MTNYIMLPNSNVSQKLKKREMSAKEKLTRVQRPAGTSQPERLQAFPGKKSTSIAGRLVATVIFRSH
jgi:hypothetical protein